MSKSRHKSHTATEDEASKEPTDGELAGRIQTADEGAFKLLYHRYYERLFKFVWRRVQNDEAAKDIMQTLFIRLWQNRERIDVNQALKPYLYQIATNLVVDFFRKEGQTQSFSIERLETEPNEELQDRFEFEEAIDKAISALPEPWLVVYKLSRYEGLKNAEIARRLGISIKTVESRMTKAFTFLRERLKPLLLMLLILKQMFE